MRIPQVGETYRIKEKDEGDAGYRLTTGAEVVVKDVGESITVHVTKPNGTVCELGCWVWYPERGPEIGPDGCDMNVLAQFHHHCELVE